MAPSRNLTVQIVGDTRGFDRAMVRASASSGKFAASLKAASLGAAGLAGAGVKLAVDFDRSMRNVNSIAQLPQKRFAALEKQVLKLAGKTAQAPKTLADGLYDLVSSGFNAHQSMVILAKSAKAATAGLTDTATSTAAVAAVLNAYHEKAKDAGKVSDTLFQTVNRGVITFEELAQNIGDVLPFASSLGVNLQQLGASISTMTKEGISAPETMTRIKNVMVTLLKPGDALKKAFKDLGVSSGEALIKQKGFQGALEAIIGTTNGSKAAVAKLFPNIRALGGALALTGKNAKSANQDVKAFGHVAGATNKALSQQAKSVSYQWQRLKAQTEALAISAGQKVLPAISKVIRTLSNPHLSNDQKFQRIVNTITTGIDKAMPGVEHAVEKAAPKVAAAFVKAFVSAPAWAKVLTGAFILKKLGAFGGGTGGLTGGRGGLLSKAAPIPVFVTNMGKGFAPMGGGAGGLAKDAEKVAGGGLLARGLAKVAPYAKVAGKAAGKFAALDFTINLVDSKGNPIAAGINSVHDLTFGITPKVDAQTGAKNNLAAFQKQIHDLASSGNIAGLEGIRKELNAYSRFEAPGGIKQARKDVDRLIASVRQSDAIRNFSRSIDQTDPKLEKYGAQMSAARDKLATLRKGSSAYNSVAADMRAAQKGVNDRLADMLPVSSRVRSAVKKLGVNFSNLGGDVSGAASFIAAATNQVLSGLGAKTIKFSLKMAKKYQNYGGDGTGRYATGHQRGGAILDGKPSGDSVPAMLERGEYVLNRNAVKKVGRDRLDRLNFQHAARFQQGGHVGGLKPGISAAVRTVLGHFPGLSITSTTGGGHAAGSYHYLGEAADIAGSPGVMNAAAAWIKQHIGRSLTEGIHNPNLSIKFGQQVPPSFWGASTWAGHANHIHLAVAGMLQALGFSGQIPKVGVGGPDGPMKQILTAAIAKMRKAAQGKVDAASMIGPGLESGAGLTSAGGAFDKTALKRLWVRAGGPKPLANLMAAIALAESGGDPTAHNPSGASGLWQILGVPFPGNVYDPLTNARMAVAKYMSQGLTAWTTYSDGSYRKYMQRGGLIDMLKKGGSPGMSLSPDATLGRFAPKISIPNTLATLAGPGAKHRRRALNGLVTKLNRLGVLPKKLTGNLAKLSGLDAIYGDRADRAGQLADAGLPGNVLGKTQAQWLQLELSNLLKWRNAIIDALGVVARRRQQVAVLTVQAKKRLAALRKQLDKASLARQIKTAEQHLKALQKHPKGKGKQIKAASHLLHVLSQRNKAGRTPLLREVNALTGRILPALSTQAGNLKDARGNLASSLTDIQGPGSPMVRLRSLPALGALGGSIFDVQMQLRGLSQPATATDSSTPDTSATDTTSSAKADLLQTLLQQANLRTAVSEAQFKTLRDMPPYGGSYDTGGVVPGPTGAARTAIVHGGEGVFTPDQMQAMGGNGPVTIQVVVMDGAVDPNKIRVIANQEANVVVKQQSRRGGRQLPGRAGVLH